MGDPRFLIRQIRAIDDGPIDDPLFHISEGRAVELLREFMSDQLKDLPRGVPKVYEFTGVGRGLEGTFDVGHRHAHPSKEPYDYLKSWLSMMRPFAYATQDDSWGELEKLICIIMRNYVRLLSEMERLHFERPATVEGGEDHAD